MISITTSCCDFMPYSRTRGSLGMSVYEGMEKKEKEGLDGEEEDEKKKEDEEEKEDDEEKKEGFDSVGEPTAQKNIKTEPSPMSALTQSVFGSPMPWTI